jgi:CubicO group peptidase (beta-lactamase class C family)
MIWSRIGAEYDAYMVCDPAGASTPGGGMSATLRDLGRWGQSYLDDDPRWKAVPRPFVEDILKNYDTSLITQDFLPDAPSRHGERACVSQYAQHLLFPR